MKKRITAVLVAVIMLISAFSGFSYAAAPFFTAVNNTLLPFSEALSPFYYSGVLYVPCNVFEELGIFQSSSVELGKVHLYKGAKYVDFYESEYKSVDQDGRERYGISARLHNGVFFLPLGLVCSYFDLQYEPVPYDPISIIRIMSAESVNSGRLLNNVTFIGIHKGQLQKYANDYFGEDSPTETPPPGNQDPAEPAEPEPTYEDVSVYLSFYNTSAGYASAVLNMLDASGYRCCFFAGADDIRKNPGLIRRIAGTGHSVGIWLEDGGYDEYREVSGLLFEAAKIKTVLISSGEAAETARATAENHGLIFWEASRDYGGDTQVAGNTVTERVPTDSGVRYNLRLECNGNISSILPEVLSFLRKNAYSVVKITETVTPV